MTNYLFGKDFTFTFYPQDKDGNVLTPSTDAPTIYLFKDKPSRDIAQSGTGALQTITSWVDNGNGKDISISAISDPDPTSNDLVETYYLAINFKLQSGKQTQTTILAFDVWRVHGKDEELNITTADIQVYFPEVLNYISTTNLTNMITETIEDVKTELENKNINWIKITNPSKLKKAVIRKTIANVALSQIAEGVAGLEELYNENKQAYFSILDNLKLYLDNDLDGEGDTNYKSFPVSFVLK